MLQCISLRSMSRWASDWLSNDWYTLVTRRRFASFNMITRFLSGLSVWCLSVCFWCWQHSMRCRVYVMARCPSVCLSRRLTSAACCNVGTSSRHSSTAVGGDYWLSVDSCGCGECHVEMGGHKPRKLIDFSKCGKLGEFLGNSVQPQGKIIANKVVLVCHSNICVNQLLTA